MYLMSKEDVRTVLDLKYCECCGALWLRKQGNEAVSCGACEAMWADLPGNWIGGLKKRPVSDHRGDAGAMRLVQGRATQAPRGRA